MFRAAQINGGDEPFGRVEAEGSLGDETDQDCLKTSGA